VKRRDGCAPGPSVADGICCTGALALIPNPSTDGVSHTARENSSPARAKRHEQGPSVDAAHRSVSLARAPRRSDSSLTPPSILGRHPWPRGAHACGFNNIKPEAASIVAVHARVTARRSAKAGCLGLERPLGALYRARRVCVCLPPRPWCRKGSPGQGTGGDLGKEGGIRGGGGKKNHRKRRRWNRKDVRGRRVRVPRCEAHAAGVQ